MEKPAEKIPGPIKQPVWMKTAFGWVVLGVEGGFAVCLDWIEKGKGDEEYLDWIEKGKEERERGGGGGGGSYAFLAFLATRIVFYLLYLPPT